ncbi:hypothetical protein ABB37_00658 [Leptomonas pyrrhocoris]|uniref:Uncharacterized protein n=1 Tax=Leptomonas pyrrhocoris TaxID=157538 RepID=A0A0N0E0J4_LEPPY|nr:hypothetical protein ABB37_00658 [Leptomonas pyrrhocoris]KPA86512.1 hypothetical protein ABB37_00658 [Leptomonas pyrrhocoris]|eukprot:XP_015664951.1 hypothetical protein ABB37_00658 [Leptomonas pyrrhocoris]
MPAGIVALHELPVSTLSSLLERYKADLERTSPNESDCIPLKAVDAQAERLALQRLLTNVSTVEFASCSNSPFFSPEMGRQETVRVLKYARRIAHTITRPTYGRYLKMVMLLLRELRFVVFAHDAQLFSRNLPFYSPQSVYARGRAAMEGRCGGDTVQKVAEAFQLIASQRYYGAMQLLQQRNNMAKDKNTPFARALMTVFTGLTGCIRTVCAAQLALRDAEYAALLVKNWSQTSLDIVGAVEELQATPMATMVEYLTDVGGRIRLCAATHASATRGSALDCLCRRLQQTIYVSCASLRREDKRKRGSPLPKLTPPPAVLLQVVTSGGGRAMVEGALTSFIHIVDQFSLLAPDLNAMNYLLQLYGLEEADLLAHEADVIDGTTKRLNGVLFEEKMFEAELRDVVLQVLVPHCCAVTGCEEAMAQAWVLACLRIPPTSMSAKEDSTSDSPDAADAVAGLADMPVWTRPATAAPNVAPPQYRLVRNVHYDWDDAGLLWMPRTDGELDGVVYDAQSRQVLFVLEAKLNIADLGKASNQKDRLFGALDRAWNPSCPPPSSKQGKAPRRPVNFPARSTSVPIKLVFSVADKTDAASPVTAAADGDETPLHDAVEDDVDGAEDGDAAAAVAVEEAADETAGLGAAPLASAKKMTLFFTQDNFTEFFRGPPLRSSPAGAAADAAPQTGNFHRDVAGTALTVSRECRWVYLTSLRPKSDAVNSTAPAPGGEVYLVEMALASAVGDAVAEAYHRFCMAGPNGGLSKAALTSLFLSIGSSSFFVQCVLKKKGDAGIASVPRLQLDLSFPTDAMLSSSSVMTQQTSSCPYTRALQLWKNRVRLVDDTLAVQQVQLRNDFLSELQVSDRSLSFAVNTVEKRVFIKAKKTPSFCEVVKSLMNVHCLRNLVMVIHDHDDETSA